MSRKMSLDATGGHEKPKNLIRSQYKDVMVKVDEDVYYLDRLQLALKSGYFEKLFIEDYADKNNELIEIPVMDTDTFSAIVDIIYGAKLKSVVDSDNYISLLMAMDYLQMKINPKTYTDLVERSLDWDSSLNMSVFKLYYFISGNANYEYLLPTVFEHLSTNLETLKDLDEFLLIPFDHFLKIILVQDYKPIMKQRLCSKICAKWICHDLENRFLHVITLVNAIKSRLELPFDIDPENLSLPLPTFNKHLNQDTISGYFYKLLEYNGLICSTKTDDPGQKNSEKNEGSESENKLKSDSDDQSESDSNDELDSDSNDELDSDSNDELDSDSDNQLDSDSDNQLDSDSDNQLESDSDNQLDSNYESQPESKYRLEIRKKKKKQYVRRSIHEPTLRKFLKDGNFCDVIVKAGGKKYKLHRSVLKSASGYFEEIFSAEYTEMQAKCDEIPALPSIINKEYFLNEIDQKTFDIIVDYIYSEKVRFNADIIVRLFKAAYVLKIDDLLKYCQSWMMKNSKDVCASDVIELLNFTHGNVKYKNLNRLYLSKYVVDSWPEIGNLPQFADLFKAIAVPEKISGRTGEHEVYLFNNVDRGTFQVIINYIYHDKWDLTNDNVVRVLKASEIFKMEGLMKICKNWLISDRLHTVDLNSEDLVEVLRFGLRNTTYSDLITVYLVKHMMQWPEIDNSLFCSISYEALENMLMSPDLYFDDPCKILDICSKWITHDMKNRYHLVPQIALAISRNGLVDCDKFAVESPPDKKNCFQDFVKDKLLEILSSTSVVPSTVSSNKSKKFKTEQPIFIASKKDKIFSILNSNLDEIISLHICKYVRGCAGELMSATMINDNLFLIFSIDRNSFFHVYNFSSKKTFSLALDSRFNASARVFHSPKYTLLNCCNELYCCFETGEILKYSFELNRWKIFSESEPNKNKLQFTSDGHTLYRMYKISESENITFVMEAYDFEQTSWISLPGLPVLRHARNAHVGLKSGYKLTFMNKFGFAVLFDTVLYLLKQNIGRWRTMSFLPYDYTNVNMRHSIITQDESGKMLYLLNNKLHSFSRSNQMWQLKRELSLLKPTSKFQFVKIMPYETIVAIHMPIIRT